MTKTTGADTNGQPALAEPAPIRGAATVALVLLAGIGVLAHAASPATPSSGTVFKQSAPPPAMPGVPTSVLSLPAPAQQASQAKVNIPVEKIIIEGNDLVPTAQLQSQVQPVVGQTVTLARLQDVAKGITDDYRKRGYSLAYAYIPAQTIRDGLIKIAVVEPRYDQVKITGDARLKPAQARRIVGVRPDEPVTQDGLERGLLLLHRTPGIRAAGTLVPGAQTATSTLEVGLDDKPLLSGSLSADNYGSEYTGRLRTNLNVSVNDPLGYGSQLAVNGLTTESGLLHAGGATFVSPNIWNGLRAGAYGSRTDYELGGQFAALDQHGRAEQMGVDLTYPLVLQPGRLLSARLDFVRNDFEQHINSVGVDQSSHTSVFQFSLDGAYADPWGGVNSGGVSVRRGELTLDSKDARLVDDLGPDTRGDFWVGQFRLGRSQPLPAQFDLRVTLRGQWASKNLDGSEKFYLGGPYGVMSAPVGDAGGDDGLLVRARLGHSLGLPPAAGELTGALLAQAGTVWVNHHDYAGAAEPNRLKRYGVGAGLDYNWRDRLSGRIAYVHQVGADDRPAQSGDDDDEILGQLQLDF